MTNKKHFFTTNTVNDRAQAQHIMEEAHKTCPYSKALRGDTSVKLVVD